MAAWSGSTLNPQETIPIATPLGDVQMVVEERIKLETMGLVSPLCTEKRWARVSVLMRAMHTEEVTHEFSYGNNP